MIEEKVSKAIRDCKELDFDKKSEAFDYFLQLYDEQKSCFGSLKYLKGEAYAVAMTQHADFRIMKLTEKYPMLKIKN